jgi:hypothetical protein
VTPDRATRARPVPPFHVRQLTIEDGLTLAASPQPAAWQVHDALEPFPPDEGYWAVADSQDVLLGFCCLGEPARAPGEASSSSSRPIREQSARRLAPGNRPVRMASPFTWRTTRRAHHA